MKFLQQVKERLANKEVQEQLELHDKIERTIQVIVFGGLAFGAAVYYLLTFFFG